MKSKPLNKYIQESSRKKLKKKKSKHLIFLHNKLEFNIFISKVVIYVCVCIDI